jgi:hypothetical protein
MKIATSLWFKNLRANKPSAPSPRHRLDEMYKETVQIAYDYMADHGQRIQSEFDDLFDGNLRVAIPLVEGDTKNLIEIVDVLKAEDWLPALEGSRFQTKQVKQKKRRLGTGEEYEEEVEVASLDLAKTFDFTIPAGPRKGDVITKTNRTTMSRAIAKAVKHGRMRRELLDWWQKKQTFYTRDPDGWERIQEAFAGNIEGDEWRIILSRHPVDVLRMSDVSDIASCHSEGAEYFKCAVEESKGNGLIAYLVKTEELNTFLAASQGTPLQRAQQLLVHTLQNEKYFEVGHQKLNDTDGLEMWLDLIKTELWIRLPGSKLAASEEDLRGALDLITIEMARDALHAKIDNRVWPEADDLPQPKPLEDFDQEEIFRDPERDIGGIGATSRVRLRKFFDTASGDFIAVPESRIYGRQLERFRQAVREWSWLEQKEMFIDPADPEHLELPRQSYLVRYGGSWSDNPDGEILNRFFSMSGHVIESYHGSTTHEHDEGASEREASYNEAQAELEETLNTADNIANHVSFDAELNEEDWETHYVYGGANVPFSFPVDYAGPLDPEDRNGYHFPHEEDGYTTIPNSINSNSSNYSLFKSTVYDAFDEGAEQLEWSVISRPDRPPHNYGHQLRQPDRTYTTTLDLDFRIPFEENTVGEYEYFSQYVIDDIDEKYDAIYEKIRRALVEQGFLPENDFDRLAADIRRQGNKLKTWEVLGFEEDGSLDDDGEIWYLFKPDGAQLIPLGDLPPILGNTLEAVRLVFGTPGSILPGSNGREIYPGVLFMNIMGEKLKPLQDAANGYVESQIELDFGDKYSRPSYEGVDFGHAQVRLVANFRNPRDVATVEIKMKVVIEASADEEDITGALEFMRFVDQYPNQIRSALVSTYGEFVDNAMDKKKEKHESIMDGTVMEKEVAALKSKYAANADNGDASAEQAMLVGLFIQQNWSEFNQFEKYGAIENYLVPLSVGSARPYGMWSNDTNTPTAWDGIIRSKMAHAKVSNAGNYSFGGDWRPGPNRLAIFQNKASMTPEESVLALRKYDQIKDEAVKADAWAAVMAGDKDGFNDIVNKEIERILDQVLGNQRGTLGDPQPAGGPIVRNARGQTMTESAEQQIERIDGMLNERDPIDLRIYKVALGCVVDTSRAGRDQQIENQIRGIKEVTTVRNLVQLERDVGRDSIYRVYEIKFELSGQQARDTYRDAILVPSIEKEVTGVTVRERGMPELADAPLREWGGLGYAAGTPQQHLPQMVTPRVTLDSVVEDWAEGGVQIYDTPQNTNQMQYHVMMPVSELWPHCARYYRGNKTDFDGRYKHFIKSGAQMPVYVALGQNGRVRITGGEDLIWFAKKSGLEELPVFFSYQKQV